LPIIFAIFGEASSVARVKLHKMDQSTHHLDKMERRRLAKLNRKKEKKAEKKAKHKALMTARAAANGTSSKTASSCGTSTSTGTVPDIEDVVQLDPMRWKNYKARVANPKLKPYVLELNKELESMRDKYEPKALDLNAFSYATSAVLKRFKDPECRGKSELVHVYRELVQEGKIKHDQNIENMMVKKLSKSLFGGINLSIFIPPGHTAPFWTVDVILISKDQIQVKTLQKKSSYDLQMYANYVNVKPGDKLSLGGKYSIIKLEPESMIISLSLEMPGATKVSSSSPNSNIGVKRQRIKKTKHIWDLDDISTFANSSTAATYPIIVASNVILKGTMSIKTCTFGCVYCPTEKTKEGQQANPKSYLTHEPGVLRAVRNGYDTASQVYDRVISLRDMGHNCSKVFVRCVGGTWSVVTRN
jgi:hypothetical protein